MTKTAIECAQMEREGQGEFRVFGRQVVFLGHGRSYRWPCRTAKQAREHLALFRAAPSALREGAIWNPD